MEEKKDFENEVRQVEGPKFFRVIGTDGVGGVGVRFA